MDFEHCYLVFTALIFNISIVVLIFKASGAVSLREVLREKNPDTAKAAPRDDHAEPEQPGDSYSRITGLVGAVVLTCFIWAVGNTVIYNAFLKPENVKNILDGVGTFIVSGSALFAPYAFNQLSQVFGKK